MNQCSGGLNVLFDSYTPSFHTSFKQEDEMVEPKREYADSAYVTNNHQVNLVSNSALSSSSFSSSASSSLSSPNSFQLSHAQYIQYQHALQQESASFKHASNRAHRIQIESKREQEENGDVDESKLRTSDIFDDSSSFFNAKSKNSLRRILFFQKFHFIWVLTINNENHKKNYRIKYREE